MVKFSKVTLWVTVILGVLKDAFTDSSNFEVLAFIVTGMISSIAIYVVFEKDKYV